MNEHPVASQRLGRQKRRLTMVPVIPQYITAIVILINFAALIAVWSILSYAASRSGLPRAVQKGFRAASAVFLGGWLAAAFLFAPAPASLLARDRFFITPVIPAVDVTAIVLAFLMLWRSSTLRRVIDAAPASLLIGVQLYRAIGVIFLILLAQRQLPAHFALPAGWGDIAVGLAAPFVAWAVAREVQGSGALAAIWNVLGLADLVVAVGMGTGLLTPILLPDLGRLPAASALGVFPLILIPTFTVPMSLILHLLSLRALAHRDVPVALPALKVA